MSRKWSGKTLADHRADRKAWLLATLGIPDANPARYTWEPATPGDPDHMPPALQQGKEAKPGQAAQKRSGTQRARRRRKAS